MSDPEPPSSPTAIRACVTMTACIAPPAASGLLYRVDPAVRLEDYLAALRFWLDVPDPRIVAITLVENSGASLEPLRALAAAHNPHGRDVEIGHFGDNVIPPGVSYGFPELTMLNDASRRARAWLDPRTTHIIKATGRLRFPRISRLLDRMTPDVELMADARDRRPPWRRHRIGGALGTQLMLFTPAFYRAHLAALRDRMGPGELSLIENVAYHQLYETCDGRRVRFRFPINCPPSGEAGAWHKSYDAPRERLQNAVRAVARRVAPSWWI